jgi:hypothetical protein
MALRSKRRPICCWLAVVTLAMISGTVAAQTRHPKQVSSVAELLALAADPKTDFDAMQVFRFLAALPNGEERAVEHQLLRLPHERLIAAVLVHVLNTRDSDAAEVIASQVSGWAPTTQLSALDVAGVARGPFLAIPRTLLRDAIGGAKISAAADVSTDVIGDASIVLARTGSPTDLKMIQTVAGLQPRSWGVWMALAYWDGMNASLTAVAESVFQDPSAALPLRLAAATALEPFDNKAAAYAVDQVQLYLTQFGGQDAAAFLSEAIRASGKNGLGPAALQYATFEKNMPMMSALLVLKAEAIHQLTIENLNAKNQLIRRLCGIVAARRWPADLLKAGQGLFSSKEYLNLAATITIYRPEQAAAAARVAAAEKMSAAKSLIMKSGLGVVLPEAGGTLSHFQ